MRRITEIKSEEALYKLIEKVKALPGIQEVGISHLIVNGKKEIFKYKDCECDEEGFVDIRNFLPLRFDIVHLKTDHPKVITGWWTGEEWDGLRLKTTMKVLKWRKDFNFF